MTAADTYASRVDAVLAQRTRLRGPQPTADPYGVIRSDSSLSRVDPRGPAPPNLEIIASYVEPDDVIVDVGGGGGRFGLPLALRCREVINVDATAQMAAAFEENARRAGVTNVHAIHADWLDVDPPSCTLALAKHVAYLTPEIVPFIEKLEAAATRRVLITVNSPTPLEWNRVLFERIHGEVEQSAPGHVELMNVLWEMGIQPDLRMLPQPANIFDAHPDREAAIERGLIYARIDQWANWPLTPELEQRARQMFEIEFDDLFVQTADGYFPAWLNLGREVLITWAPRR